LAFDRPEEADLVDAMRREGILTLSLVAWREGRLVGHVAFSPAQVDSPAGGYQVISLAPVAVAPTWQRQGIGAALIGDGLGRLKSLGYRGVVVLGHAEYYPRFGFVPASSFGIKWEHPCPDEAFMALELSPGFFAGSGGLVRFHPIFEGV